MQVLGESVFSRYKELLGKNGDFPEGHEGKYIYEIAENVIEKHKNTIL